MKITTIVWSMMIILAGLIVLGKFLIPREKRRSENEALYAEALFKFQMDQTDENKKALEAAAEKMGQAQGLSKDESDKRLERDLAILN